MISPSGFIRIGSCIFNLSQIAYLEKSLDGVTVGLTSPFQAIIVTGPESEALWNYFDFATDLEVVPPKTNPKPPPLPIPGVRLKMLPEVGTGA